MDEEKRASLRIAIAEHLGIDPASVSDDKRIQDDLEADSLDAVEIVMMVEEKFGVEVPDDVAEGFTTVGDVADWIEKKSR